MIRSLNHVSRESPQVELMAAFYTTVLGFKRIARPNFPFRGAWLEFPGGHGLQMHLIEPDPQGKVFEGSLRDPVSGSMVDSDARSAEVMTVPISIRRGHHLALEMSVTPEEFKQHLKQHGVPYTVFDVPGMSAVPGTDITQFFLFDPDGNGIEIGNFSTAKALPRASATVPQPSRL